MEKINIIILSITCFFFSLLVISALIIGRAVKNKCHEAIKLNSGDCVSALIKVLNDDSNSFRERNSAVWAMGQLGDRKALSYLRQYYSGNIPKRESLDKGLSQYELKKAINLASGGINITSIFWRNSFFLKTTER